MGAIALTLFLTFEIEKDTPIKEFSIRESQMSLVSAWSQDGKIAQENKSFLNNWSQKVQRVFDKESKYVISTFDLKSRTFHFEKEGECSESYSDFLKVLSPDHVQVCAVLVGKYDLPVMMFWAPGSTLNDPKVKDILQIIQDLTSSIIVATSFEELDEKITFLTGINLLFKLFEEMDTPAYRYVITTLDSKIDESHRIKQGNLSENMKIPQ